MENGRGKFYIVPLVIGLTLATGMLIGTMFTTTGGIADPVAENTSKFQTILELIEEKYVDSVDHDLLIESSIQGMITELDPHSAYIPASDLAMVNEQLEGRFGGVGIRFLIHEDSLVVTHIIPNAPAAAAGLKPGDRIVAVDGKNIADGKLTTEDVMEMLKGKEGSDVEVTVERYGSRKDYTIERGQIPISSIDAAIMLNKDVGFIKLNSFTHNSALEFSESADKLKAQGMKKLIFDLRNNGGGIMDAATDITDEFLPDGKMIVYTEGRKEPYRAYYATEEGDLDNMEVIVLINSLSASASEIVAGALQDNDCALIMGRRSFGKGLVQDQTPFKDGSALRLTISRYYTPTGRSIQKPYGKDIDYYGDYYERFDSGEMMNEDSMNVDENAKFTTPAGRTVYGGGGIYPDIFIPNDTAGASYYLTELYYANAFNHFAVRFLDKNRSRFGAFEDFQRNFQISNEMFLDFIQYAVKLGIAENPVDIITSRAVIKNRIKAEIARHLWQDDGYFAIYIEDDLDVQRALAEFGKGKSLMSLLYPERNGR